jgi:hypothetical protein
MEKFKEFKVLIESADLDFILISQPLKNSLFSIN